MEKLQGSVRVDVQGFEKAWDLINKGVTRDLHLARAMIETGIQDPSMITKEQRAAAKLLNYWALYSG